jgi:hypothetical protein
MNTQTFCERKGKDFNKATKRCVKKCNAGEKRNKTFKCRSIHKITKKICDSKNKDFNRFTKKCIQKCNIDKRRYFYCPTKTKERQFTSFSTSRLHPCDKSKFGIYTKKSDIHYNARTKKFEDTFGKKNYGTVCNPKCLDTHSKYNIDTNRCRRHRWLLKKDSKK